MATKPVKRTTQTSRKKVARPATKKTSAASTKAAKPTKKLSGTSSFGTAKKTASTPLTNAPTKQRGGISRNLNAKPKSQAATPSKANASQTMQKAAATKEAQTAAAQEKQPAQQPQGAQAGGIGDWISGGIDKLKEGIGQLQPKPTPEERKALEGVRDMLEPNKLGGEDETFNFGDRKEIIKGLLQDKEGLKQEVADQLKKDGKSWQIPIAKNAIDGKGLLAGSTMKKINKQFTQEMVKRLNAGLQEANIDPKTAKDVDNQKRDLTFEEMRQFEQNTELLEAFQKRVAEQVGFQVVFPNGISQEAIEHTLEGKLGIPPGGVIK